MLCKSLEDDELRIVYRIRNDVILKETTTRHYLVGVFFHSENQIFTPSFEMNHSGFTYLTILLSAIACSVMHTQNRQWQLCLNKFTQYIDRVRMSEILYSFSESKVEKTGFDKWNIFVLSIPIQ